MRRLLVALVATFLVLSVKTYSEDEIIHFPDTYFKKVLVNMDDYVQPRIDLNMDGEIQRSEAVAYKSLLWLSFGKDSITDLTGIKEFINVGRIWLEECPGITAVDLSGMLNLREVNFNYNPNLKKLDFAGCINLSKLDCSESILNEINLTNCKNINAIWLSKNALTELNIKDCPQIQYLFTRNNKLANIDVTQAKELRRLQIQGNLVTSLDVSSLPKLDQLLVSDNKLKTLNIKNGNNTLLTSFKATNNPDLKCITVDDANYSKENWKDIDEWTEFSEDCSTGINENISNSFKVFPNPAKNSVFIERESIEFADLRILDITGRICLIYPIHYGETQIQLDISKLPVGKYIIDIKNETGSLIVE
jgi:hypothetical protein